MADDIRIISADSHVTIPNELVHAHLPEKLKGKVAEAEKAYAAAMLAAKPQKAAQAELKKEREASGASNMATPNMGAGAPWPAAGRPGESNAIERLKDMDIDGVEAEVLYSQSAFGFDGGTFYRLKSAEARVACFQAYNNALQQWIEAAPNRLIPVGIIPVLDPAEGVAELERLAGMGFKALTVPTYPTAYAGLAPYWEDQYKPLWQSFAASRIPLSLHTTASPGLAAIQASDPTPAKGIMQSLPPIVMAELISTWILGGMVPANPDLRIVLVESGIGWIAYYLERLDTMQRRHNWGGRGMIKEKPSSYWAKQFFATFEDDMAGMRTIDMLGADTLMFATDYPHPDSTWPESQDVVERHFGGLPDDVKQMIAWKNAAELYKID
jgi:predicted TIM-barrel fold metal-dependent hydrolase